MSMRRFFISTVMLLGMTGVTLADNCLHQRGGIWVSPQHATVRLHLVAEEQSKITLEIDGRVLAINDRQVSPDRQTILIWWEGGEGVLICGAEDTVVASLFDRTIPVRSLTLVRPKS